MIDLIWICWGLRRTHHFPLAEYFVNKLPHFLFHLNKKVWEMFNFGRSNISSRANDCHRSSHIQQNSLWTLTGVNTNYIILLQRTHSVPLFRVIQTPISNEEENLLGTNTYIWIKLRHKFVMLKHTYANVLDIYSVVLENIYSYTWHFHDLLSMFFSFCSLSIAFLIWLTSAKTECSKMENKSFANPNTN